MTTWPPKCTVSAGSTVSTVPPWMMIMPMPSWPAARRSRSCHRRLGRHGVRERPDRAHPVWPEREHGHRVHSQPGQVAQVLPVEFVKRMALAGGKDEARQRRGGPGRLLELAPRVAAADLVDGL